MVRIIQAEHAPGLLELLRRETFQRGLRCDGHEHGKRNRTMREMKQAGAGFCGLQSK